MKDFDSEWQEAQEVKPFGYESVQRPGAPQGGRLEDDNAPDCVDLLETTCWLETDSAVWDVASPSWVEPMAITALKSLTARRNGAPDTVARQKGLTLSEEERQAIRYIVGRACRREVLLTDARISVIGGVLSGVMLHETITMIGHMVLGAEIARQSIATTDGDELEPGTSVPEIAELVSAGLQVVQKTLVLHPSWETTTFLGHKRQFVATRA
eukprot:5200072-Amphidinium_carterae.1